jgi:hypothetical protein
VDVGPNDSCSPITSHGDGEDEVVIIVRSTKTNKVSLGVLFDGVGGVIGTLKSVGVVHDGV